MRSLVKMARVVLEEFVADAGCFEGMNCSMYSTKWSR